MDEWHQAIKVFNQGGIVIFPTDTVFGIGCRMDNKTAIERLFDIKQRPKVQAVPVLVENINMAQKYLVPLSGSVRKLMETYWPGGLTIVYPCKIKQTPPLVRGSSPNLGVRMPSHSLVIQLLKTLGVPVLAPSANFHGHETPTRAVDLDKQLVKLVDFVVSGECQKKCASTVVDCTKTPWQILRQGNVKISI